VRARHRYTIRVAPQVEGSCGEMNESDAITSSHEQDAAASALRPAGRYEIRHEIGRGGMGVVYLARQRDLDRLVALKALHSFHATAEFTERFVRESRLAGSLSHPNIVTVYEFFEDDQTPYISMEYVPRGSLRWWVGHLSLGQLAGVLEGLLAGLAAVEPSGIVHRDLKPENVMVTADGRVKIADFGIAKATEEVSGANIAATSTGETMGTPAYMAPEQALCGEVGSWTDLYAVGVMAYEQLVGHVPFHDSKTPMAILLRQVNESIAPVTDSRPDVDRPLSEWVGRLLIKDPDRRTRSPMQAWEELEEIIIRLLGPRWRRDARLADRSSNAKPTPLASPQFESQRISVPIALPHRLQAADPPVSVTMPTRQPRELVDATVPRPSRVPTKYRIGLGVLAAVGLAASLGFAVAHSRSSAPTAQGLANKAATATFEVAFPPGWQRGSSPPARSILQLDKPLVLNSPYSGGALSIGGPIVPGAALLPASFSSMLTSPSRREAISLGGTAFYRVRDVRISGASTTETVYAQPTTAGILVAECWQPRTHIALVAVDCERVLSSLRLKRAKPLPLGLRPTYALAMSRAISDLNRARVSDARQLANAPTPQAQAAASERLSRAYARAAASLRNASPGAVELAANASAVTALESAAHGYSALAAGARSESRRAFGSGRNTVAAATTALGSALSELSKLS
jgi:serine/threonine protein kinase